MTALPYITLFISWLVFGLLHSLLAADSIKQVARRRMKESYKYYRLLYSLLAAANLLIVLHYHFSCDGPLLWKFSRVEGVLSFMAALAGLAIMAVCILKYFPGLSGIDAILGTARPQVLQLDGLHAYVRHPLYSGTLLFVWAVFFGYPHLNNLISCLCVTLYTLIGLYFEEKKLEAEFGVTYTRYKATVPALIPVVIRK